MLQYNKGKIDWLKRSSLSEDNDRLLANENSYKDNNWTRFLSFVFATDDTKLKRNNWFQQTPPVRFAD